MKVDSEQWAVCCPLLTIHYLLRRSDVQVSEKRDEKLGGDQPLVVWPRPHWRVPRRPQKSDEDGIEQLGCGGRLDCRLETVWSKAVISDEPDESDELDGAAAANGIQDEFGDDLLRDSGDRGGI